MDNLERKKNQRHRKIDTLNNNSATLRTQHQLFDQFIGLSSRVKRYAEDVYPNLNDLMVEDLPELVNDRATIKKENLFSSNLQSKKVSVTGEWLGKYFWFRGGILMVRLWNHDILYLNHNVVFLVIVGHPSSTSFKFNPTYYSSSLSFNDPIIQVTFRKNSNCKSLIVYNSNLQQLTSI